MEKNIYSKLAKVRVELQSRNLKKSGFNKFANFKYFELSDFLPTINELCEKEGILTVFNIDGVFARLDVIECETGAKIEFLTHVIQAQMKGSNPIQELGATHTYLRRFLMLMAFEITDGDVVDALPQEEKKNEPTKPSKSAEKPVKQAKKDITAEERIILTTRLAELVDEEHLPNLYTFFNVQSLEDMTSEQLEKAIVMKEKRLNK